MLDEKLGYVKEAQLNPREEAFKQYQNLAGEAEARLTQNRAGMNEIQRRMFYPFKQLPEHGGLDINPNEAIIKGLRNY